MISKEHNSVIHRFKTDLCRSIVVYMKEHNIPMTAIFSEDVLDMIPKCAPVYEQLLKWKPKDPKEDDRWYTSQKHILRQVDKDDGIVYYASLSFTFPTLRGILFKNYLTHKISWR